MSLLVMGQVKSLGGVMVKIEIRLVVGLCWLSRRNRILCPLFWNFMNEKIL